MKMLTVTAAVVSIFALATLAYGDMGGYGMDAGMKCECGEGNRMMEAQRHMANHFMALNLDEQQKVIMGEIRSRMMKETIRRTADMHIAEIELKELLGADPVDMKAVEAKVKQLEMMKSDMHLSHIKAMENCKTKLTSEQRKKLKEMMETGSMKEGMGMKHDEKCGMTKK